MSNTGLPFKKSELHNAIFVGDLVFLDYTFATNAGSFFLNYVGSSAPITEANASLVAFHIVECMVRAISRAIQAAQMDYRPPIDGAGIVTPLPALSILDLRIVGRYTRLAVQRIQGFYRQQAAQVENGEVYKLLADELPAAVNELVP